jgi:hypothetical protein
MLGGGVPLKRLLMHEASPYAVTAIVHQEVMAKDVDGIPVIQNDEFLSIAKTTKVQAVLMLKDEMSRSLWLRRGHEVGLQWLDEGQIFLRTEHELRGSGVSMDLGILQLPEAFNEPALSQLKAHSNEWRDLTSKGIFRAYLQFLESGILSPLKSVANSRPEHPVRQTGEANIAACVSQLGGGLAWEIATDRTSFIEQVVLVAGMQPWTYASSSINRTKALFNATALKRLLSPLGIGPMASEFDVSDRGRIIEREIEGFKLPQWEGKPRFVRLDVEEPASIAAQLSKDGGQLCAWIRVGRSPRQLLELLQLFPIEEMSLICDRPGPLGLQVQLRTNFGKKAA